MSGKARRKKSKKTKKMAKARKVARKSARKARRVKAPGAGRVLKAYRLVKAIPESIGAKTAGRSILAAIEAKDGAATAVTIREEIGPKVPAPTLRFYLGKFQRDKIIAAA